MPVHSLSDPSFIPIQVGVLTISDTRTKATDHSGQAIIQPLTQAGHWIHSYELVSDHLIEIRQTLSSWITNPSIDVIITTGGTGITARDVTPEALEPLVTKAIPGFGELFRWLSYAEIGTSTIQSRAQAALCQSTLVFLLPGSTSAVRMAMERILLQQLDARHRPCNFVELLPRIRGETS